MPEWTLKNLTRSPMTPDDIKKHLADRHQFEADNSLSIGQLENLHRRLHEDEDKEEASKKALV